MTDTKQKRFRRSELETSEAVFRQIYRAYRGNARNHGRAFLLTKVQFNSIITKDCFYCGSSPSNERQARRCRGETVYYNGIDRRDNLKGYIEGNCIPCCSICNRAKRDLSFSEFISYLNNLTIARVQMITAFEVK